MRSKSLFWLALPAAAALVLALTGCGSAETGPKPPQPGTVTFRWNATLTAYKAGDYHKAADGLVELSSKENEFSARARVLSVLLESAIATGNMELAAKMKDTGLRNRAVSKEFIKLENNYRAEATAAAKIVVEAGQRFVAADKGKDVTLAWELPAASLDDPAQYKKFSTGQAVPDAEYPLMEKAVIGRAALKTMALALGENKDPLKAKALYQNGEAPASAAAISYGAAKALVDVAELLAPKKLNQPVKWSEMLYEQATELLKTAKDGKETKDLAKKIAENKKKLKG
jgi:hypothetical protein